MPTYLNTGPEYPDEVEVSIFTLRYQVRFATKRYLLGYLGTP